MRSSTKAVAEAIAAIAEDEWIDIDYTPEWRCPGGDKGRRLSWAAPAAPRETNVEPTGLAIRDVPSITDRLVRIVDFRVAAGLTPSAVVLTQNLVDSLVASGQLLPQAADGVAQAVLARIRPAPTPTTVTTSVGPTTTTPANPRVPVARPGSRQRGER